MYLSFYGLKKKPFQIVADPSFLWLGEKHQEALATLKYGILENQGFLILTGDIGTGKTTLINALINNLGDEVIVAKVPDPGMETIDFMNYISHAFEMKKKFSSKDAFLIHFGHFLNSTHAAGKKALLIIDEAQRLSAELLEEIRQLSNIEKQDTKLLNIFFIGHNEFNDVLLENKNRALHQRITINYFIDPLDVHETGEFIRYRLKIAGAESDIFSPEAIQDVFEGSDGVPRRINIICDHCLLSGFVQRTKTITSEMVKECVKDLLLPVSSKNINSGPREIVDNAESENVDSENFQEIPAERLQQVSSGKRWIITTIIALIAMILLIVAYIKDPREFRNFFSRVDNNDVQFFGGESVAKTLNIDTYSETAQEKASTEGLEISPEIMVTGEGGQEVLVDQEPSVKNVESVGVIPEKDRSENLDPHLAVPDLVDESVGAAGEGSDATVTSNLDSTNVVSLNGLNKKKASNEEVTEETLAISETVVVEEMETASDPELVEKPAVFENQHNSDLDFEPAENSVQETESKTPYENQISLQNQEEVVETESVEAVISTNTEEETKHKISLKPVTVVAKEESEVVLTEIPGGSEKVEDIPETDMVEQPVVIFESAGTQAVPTHPVNQQSQTIDEVTENNQPVFEPAEIVLSPTKRDQDNLEVVEAVARPEAQDQASRLAEVKVKMERVTDTIDPGQSGEIETEVVEPQKTDVNEVVEIEDDVAQTISKDRLSEPAVPADFVEPVESAATKEAVPEESGDLDPGALIDWVLNKRSE